MAGPEKWANMATITAIESAANTLTFQKLDTGISLFEKLAWVIHRAIYKIGIAVADFGDTGDYLDYALCATNSMSDITDLANPAIIDWRRFIKIEDGTPATTLFFDTPFIQDFSMLPGGGIIVAPNPLYLAVKGTGLVNAQTVKSRILFTTVQLKPDEYWELVESRRVIAS
jgi:hypothetical protein